MCFHVDHILEGASYNDDDPGVFILEGALLGFWQHCSDSGDASRCSWRRGFRCQKIPLAQVVLLII